MLIARRGGDLYLERRPPSGLWGGLWSFPELGSDEDVGDWCERRFDSRPLSVTEWATFRHSFSHYDLDILPLVVQVEAASRRVADSAGGGWYPLAETPAVGLAAPVEKLMNSLREERMEL